MMKSLKKTFGRKGQAMSQLGALAAGVAGLAIALTVTFLVLGQGRTQAFEIEGLTNCVNNASSLTVNATNTLFNAVQTIPGWVPLIIVAVIGAILLGLVALFQRQ